MFISLDLPEDSPLDWKTTLEDLERDYSALVNGLFDAQLKGRVRDMQHKAAHSKMGANIVRFPFKIYYALYSSISLTKSFLFVLLQVGTIL